jgi:hypothetical protein
MGFPAIGISGLGMVSVCGLSREPLPAMGTIIFIFLMFLALDLYEYSEIIFRLKQDSFFGYLTFLFSN